MKSWRNQSIEGLKQGDTFRFARTFTPRDVEVFGEITRDYNPVHYDDEFAQIKGFAGKICHGLLVGALVCELGGQLAWLASGMEFAFLRPVYFGDTVHCTLTIESVDEKGFALAKATMENQHGTEVIRARLKGFLPGEKETGRLSRMVAEGDPTNKLGGEGQ